MKQTKNTKIDLVKGYIERYIELGIKNHCGYSKKFIAKVIAAEHPDPFKDFEAVRTYIRVITQSKGKGEFYEKYNDIASRFALVSNGYDEEIQHLINDLDDAGLDVIKMAMGPKKGLGPEDLN